MSDKTIRSNPAKKTATSSGKNTPELDPDAQDMMGNSFLQQSMNNIHSKADAALIQTVT